MANCCKLRILDIPRQVTKQNETPCIHFVSSLYINENCFLLTGYVLISNFVWELKLCLGIKIICIWKYSDSSFCLLCADNRVEL